MVVIDAVTRLLPGALGNDKSAHEDSFTEILAGKKNILITRVRLNLKN